MFIRRYARILRKICSLHGGVSPAVRTPLECHIAPASTLYLFSPQGRVIWRNYSGGEAANSSTEDASKSNNYNSSSNNTEDEEEFQIKLKILNASLNHVNENGWTSNALKAGANDLNLSESIASLCTPYDLVEYFQRYSNHQLKNYLNTLDKKDKNLYASIEYRLKLVVPYISRYHEAMASSLEPGNIPRSMEVLRELSDIICVVGLGDASTDLRWYAKRSGVVSLYIATECCMVQDKSEGLQETWNFLHRRVKDYQFFENTGSSAFPFLESGITTILNIVGINRKR